MTLSTSTRPAAAIASVCLALTACGPGQPQPTPLASAPASPAMSPSASSGNGAPTAIDAYRGMWQAYVDASRIPDPQFADLSRYTDGDASKVFVSGLTSMQRDGLVSRGNVVLNPSVKAANPNASPSTVEIEDCVDTSKTELVKKDGSPYQDTPGGRQMAKATVARSSEGVWKVTSFALFGVGTC